MQYDDAFFAELRKTHRIRQFAMEARKRADLSLGALLRELLGWRKDLPTEDRKRIAEQALGLISLGEKLLKWEDRIAKNPDTKAKPPEGLDDLVFRQWQDVIMASMRSRQPMAKAEEAAKDRMNAMISEHPVLGWWHENAFKESTSLAVILAEAGDIGKYANPGKLWKRMGLAVMDGKRQGGLSRNASKDDWIAHGYSPVRRSQMFVIGEALFKQNERYNGIYRARKDYERERAVAQGKTVVPAARIPKKDADKFMSDGHVHNRAKRYMEKRFLRDLWSAWRQASCRSEPDGSMPAAPIQDAA